MSALQAARQSDLEHSGLDQDPVIEGFGVYQTHTHTADRRLQSVVHGPVVDQSVSDVEEPLCIYTHLSEHAEFLQAAHLKPRI